MTDSELRAFAYNCISDYLVYAYNFDTYCNQIKDIQNFLNRDFKRLKDEIISK